MDIQDVERLRLQSFEKAQGTFPENTFLENIERYVQSREPSYFYIANFDEFLTLTKLLDIDTVDGEAVLQIVYRNTASLCEYDGIVEYAGKWQLRVLFNDVADRHASFVEFPNNFKVITTIALDDVTAVTVAYELDEEPSICKSCSQDEYYMEHNSDYSCDHSDSDEFSEKFVAVIHDRSDTEKVRAEDRYHF